MGTPVIQNSVVCASLHVDLVTENVCWLPWKENPSCLFHPEHSRTDRGQIASSSSQEKQCLTVKMPLAFSAEVHVFWENCSQFGLPPIVIQKGNWRKLTSLIRLHHGQWDMKNKVGLTIVISVTQLSVNIKIKVYSLIVSESQFSNSQFYSRTFPINYISHNVRRFSRYAWLGILGNENINNFNPMWKIMAQKESLHHPMDSALQRAASQILNTPVLKNVTVCIEKRLKLVIVWLVCVALVRCCGGWVMNVKGILVKAKEVWTPSQI